MNFHTKLLALYGNLNLGFTVSQVSCLGIDLLGKGKLIGGMSVVKDVNTSGNYYRGGFTATCE
jgi:hypothetical protein